jgi:hypothetical protein
MVLTRMIGYLLGVSLIVVLVAAVPGVADAAAPFTGTPGTTTCIGESHTALAQKYGNLVAAANVRRLPTR